MFLTLNSAWKLLALAFYGFVFIATPVVAQTDAPLPSPTATTVPTFRAKTPSLRNVKTIAPKSGADKLAAIKPTERPAVYAKSPSPEQPPAPPETPLSTQPVLQPEVAVTAEVPAEPGKQSDDPLGALLSELAAELAEDLSAEPDDEPDSTNASTAPSFDKNSSINPARDKSFVVQASANGELPPAPAKPPKTLASKPVAVPPAPAPANPQATLAETNEFSLTEPTASPTEVSTATPTKPTVTKPTVTKPVKPVQKTTTTSAAPTATTSQKPATAELPQPVTSTHLHLSDRAATVRRTTSPGTTTKGPTIQGPTIQGQPEQISVLGDRVLELVEFDDLTLAEAMKLFAEQSGLNVITSADAGKTHVTVFLKNVTAHDALEAMVKANGLFYRIEEASGIVRIATAKEYEKDLSSFREEQTKVFTLLYPNPIAVAQVIQQVFGTRVQMSRADADVDDLVDLSRRFNRFDMVDGRSLGLGGANGANHSGRGTSGGNGMSLGNRGGMNGGGLNGLNGMNGMGGGMQAGGLGALNGAGNQALAAQSALRQREHAALNNMSAEEIQALENEMAQQGDLTAETQANLLERRDATIYISTIRRNNQIIVRTGDARSMDQIAQLIAQLDVPTPTVLLEVKVLRIVLADGFNSAFEYFGSAGNASAASSDGSLQPTFPGASTFARNLGAGLGVAGGVPGALSFQMVDDKFRVRMQLLESKNCVTALATPLILTANNEVSRIFVGDTLPFTVGFTPSQVLSSVSAVNGAVAATPITELRDVGQSLLITPNINADRTVTLRVIEENSERVLSGSSIPVPATSGTGVTNVNVDTVRRRTISGTIVAQDGMAVALGGLIEEQVSDARDQVPVLGNIPGLGLLFRRQASGRSRSELVVIVRPYVFNTPTESAATSEMLLGQLSTHPNSPTVTGTMNTLPCKVTRSETESSQRAKLFQLHNRSLSTY